MNRMHSTRIAVADYNLSNADTLAAHYGTNRRKILRQAVAKGIAKMIEEKERGETIRRLDFEQQAAVAYQERRDR
jgi:hypothetical protein